MASRLDGLPLALATAGTYLSQTADSFGEYLQLYNSSWSDLAQYSNAPLDYEDRTLYSTWNLSFTQIQAQNPAAAEMLRLMAYLDNQDLWYELFQAGAGDTKKYPRNRQGRKGWWVVISTFLRLTQFQPVREDLHQPLWWSEVVKSKARFNRVMSRLHDYSLVEIRAGSYSLHTCVHDWTLEYLNRSFNDALCGLAIHCIAQSVKWDTEAKHWVVNRRLLQHVQRLKHTRITRCIGWSSVDPADLYRVAHLYSQLDMNIEAEEMYVRALRGYEKVWGAEHTSTLETVNNLGNLYADQGKMAEAEEMYVRALRGYEKAMGEDHPGTRLIARNLNRLRAKG